ncbi:MAG: hypothetical protein ACFFAH_05290 [Promethearchaeota archaeon]
MANKVFKEDGIIIRNYKNSDYHATLEILKELHDIYNIGLKEKQWRKSSGLRQFKPNLKRITLIAELKATGEIICIGVIKVSKNALGQYTGNLNNWATKKEYIGKHVGKILADKTIQILIS